MRVVLTPTISIDLPIPKGNIMSDMKKLRLFDAYGEVNVGDVVRYGGKPCFVEHIGESEVTVVTMDERKMFIKLRPQQLGLIIGG